MATKTIVCPECQAPVVPGRYACAQCGALLASVALTPRSNDRAGQAIGSEVAPDSAPADDPSWRGTALLVDHERPAAAPVPTRTRRRSVAPAWTHSLAAEPEESPPGADERWDDQPLTASANGTAPKPAVLPAAVAAEALAPATVSDVLARNVSTRAPERKASPIAAVNAAAAPKVRRRSTPDPEALARIAPLAEPLPVVKSEAIADPVSPSPAAPASVRLEPEVLRAVKPEASPRSAPARAEPAQTAVPLEAASRPEPFVRPDVVPAWPPPGDRGPLAEPPARVPAGVYLPPSAVLPPGEALPLPSAATAEVRAASAATPAAATAERVSAADRLSQLDLPADTPRRIVAIGAVVAVLAFLLPWTASPTGNDVIGDYLIRWGLAGPGAWIIVALLLGLAGLTLAGGRLATAPVGLPGVAVAMLVLGLAWPYLFGFGGLAVGIWVVVAGLLLLAAGGLLDLRAGRHDDQPPTV